MAVGAWSPTLPGMRQLLLAAVLAGGCATMSPVKRAALEQDAQPAVDALRTAGFEVSITRSKESLARDEKDARAAAVLAISLLRQALHDAVTDAVTFASSVAVSAAGRGAFFNRDFFDFSLTRLDAQLAEVDSALAKAETDPGFTLDLQGRRHQRWSAHTPVEARRIDSTGLREAALRSTDCD